MDNRAYPPNVRKTDAGQCLSRCATQGRSVTVTNCLVLATIDLQGFGAHSDAWHLARRLRRVRTAGNGHDYISTHLRTLRRRAAALAELTAA